MFDNMKDLKLRITRRAKMENEADLGVLSLPVNKLNHSLQILKEEIQTKGPGIVSHHRRMQDELLTCKSSKNIPN